MKQFEKAHDALYLGFVRGEIWYLPNSTTRDQVVAVLERLSPPHSDPAIAREALLNLWLSTRHEKMPVEDRDAMLELYARNLSTYPESAVSMVFRQLAVSAVFFPSWAEIQKEFTDLMGWRGVLIFLLRNYATKRKAQA